MVFWVGGGGNTGAGRRGRKGYAKGAKKFKKDGFFGWAGDCYTVGRLFS
jgi:hypothetical protein